MSQSQPISTDDGTVPLSVRIFFKNRLLELAGFFVLLLIGMLTLALATWSLTDPSWNNAINGTPKNWLGNTGAIISDQLIQTFGLSVLIIIAIPIIWAVNLFSHRITAKPIKRGLFYLLAVILAAATLSLLPNPSSWALGSGMGGSVGDSLAKILVAILSFALKGILSTIIAVIIFAIGTAFAIRGATGFFNTALMAVSSPFNGRVSDFFTPMLGATSHLFISLKSKWSQPKQRVQAETMRSPTRSRIERPTIYQQTETLTALPTSDVDHQTTIPSIAKTTLVDAVSKIADSLKPTPEIIQQPRIEPQFNGNETYNEPLIDQQIESYNESDNSPIYDDNQEPQDVLQPMAPKFINDPNEQTAKRVSPTAKPIKKGKRVTSDAQPKLPLGKQPEYEFPPLTLLKEPTAEDRGKGLSEDALEQNARMLEGVLEDFGIRGEIINVRPGPVVTLYELEPAPGIKSSRVIGLAEDIARSMCAISARVAVVPGRNAIGIELPNSDRETVYLHELLSSKTFENTKHHLAIALGKDIGGEPIFTDLARMPHLLIAGTTGSGKSVGINTMILSLLYRLTPEQCKIIMIDPKMLELSVYEGIPHLLAPVVTEPQKAVVALKWAVREMEDRYRRMSKMGVRNIDGFNKKAKQAIKDGNTATRTIQTGYDPETREPIFEEEAIDLSPMPFIVVIIDEMADLMMVAGKEIEGTVQRLAQMARAAGIHVVMATQRPSVDVITGTIKANFPTRISFQVTSKIDSRTILGEQGAESLLGQGDMLFMAGGGRVSRLHGAFASDREVEEIVNHLKAQGAPDYIEAVTEEPADDPYVIPGMEDTSSNSGDDLYDKAVAIVLRDKKVSTSYIQRRLQIGYNRAATVIEKMEEEGLISSASQSGKRTILVGDSDQVSY